MFYKNEFIKKMIPYYHFDYSVRYKSLHVPMQLHGELH